jgi:hypothetical protein
MNKTRSRISTVMSLSMIVCGVLVSGALAEAEPKEGPCSNKTLKGAYGSTIEGQFLAGPAATPVRGVVMQDFDGEGNFSQVDHVVVNFVPPAIQWRPGSGTYALNADCTGTAQIIFFDGSPSLELSLVVVRSGAEIRTVVEGPGAAITSVGSARH